MVLVFIILSLFLSCEAFVWKESNCQEGQITDFVCCDDRGCSAYKSDKVCIENSYCSWNGTSCFLTRDEGNNVCCKTPVNDYCDSVTKGICPLSHQVPSGCCTQEGLAWDGILSVNTTGFVCCNAPCSDREALGCEVPPICHARSYLQADIGILGYRSGLLPYNSPYQFGQRISYNFPWIKNSIQSPYYNNILSSYGGPKAKPAKVDEITVDDLLNSMIEALSRDDDVFVFNQEQTSDPLFGKEKFGGTLDNTNFIHPGLFIDNIYDNYKGDSLSGSYGIPSYSKYDYGQPTPPVYGQSNLPIYGQPSPPVYGQSNLPVYGQPTHPVYGQPTPPVYGQSTPPVYGQPTSPVYGQPTPTIYGQPTPPVYGQSNPPVYGQPTPPVYGQPTPPVYGQPTPPVYGQPTPSVYEQSNSPMYGQPNLPNYGQATPPNYGQPSQTNYGQPSQPNYDNSDKYSGNSMSYGKPQDNPPYGNSYKNPYERSASVNSTSKKT